MGISKQLKRQLSAALEKAGKENNGDVHVVSNEGKWAVKKDGEYITTRVFSNKEEAITKASDLVEQSKSKDSVVIVHHKNGSIAKIIS